MDAVKIHNISKRFGQVMAVDDVSFSVVEGDFFGFIGPNGAGKTTTIKSMLNLLRLDSGTIELFGFDVSANLFQADIGYIPGEANLYDNLTVDQQIAYFARYYTNIDQQYVAHLKDAFALTTNKRIGDLSLGNKKKVAIVCALMNKPRLIVADEASNGLDPLMQKTLFVELNELNKVGTTIFFSSHNLEEVQHYCRNVAIIRQGRIVAVDDLKKVIASVGVRVTVKAASSFESYLIKMKIKSRILADGSMQFMYQGKMDALSKQLAKQSVSFLRIEDVSLDDIFADYYKK